MLKLADQLDVMVKGNENKPKISLGNLKRNVDGGGGG